MFGGFSLSTGYVALDYGARGVKMLQVREVGANRDAVRVVAAARIDVPLIPVDLSKPKESASRLKIDSPSERERQAAQQRMTDQIRAAMNGARFAGRRCIVSLARHDVCVQSIRLPKMPDDEMRQSASWEASQRFGFDRNAMEVDFIRTGALLQSGENREEVILIAASHAAIHARVEPVIAAGLRPMAVEASFSSLARAYSRRARRESDQESVRAVVEVGSSGSTVLILRGDQIAFCKPFAISGEAFNKAVAEHLQMDVQAAAELRAARIAALVAGNSTAADPASEAATDRAVFEAVRPLMNELIKEVTLCLRYYGVTFRGRPPERIILSGGDGMEPRLDEQIAKACKIPVAYDDSSGALDSLLGEIHTSLNRTPGSAPSWAVAMGLSIRGANRRKAKVDTIQESAPAVKEAA